MAERGEKLFIGPQVRRLRRSLGFTQAEMAGDLGISSSYVNLIEANQRPVSAKLLLRLSEVYDVNLSEFSHASHAQLQAEIETTLKDPVFDATIPRLEIEDAVGASPDLARALLRLHERYQWLLMSSEAPRAALPDRDRLDAPEQSLGIVDEVRAFLHSRQNHFDEVDRAAEKLADAIGLHRSDAHNLLVDRLRERHDCRVRILPQEIMHHRLSQWDPHRRHINVSERLDDPARRFQMATRLALLEFADLIEDQITESGLSEAAHPLARSTVAKYMAAALLMPYGRFLELCEVERYDVEILGQRFGTSYEQVAHRLTTLQRPDARGIPFFFVRVDRAGNISKRFSAGRFHFSLFGGTCPLWNIHACFETPERVRTQVIEMPDGTAYFSIARAASRYRGTYADPAPSYAIGLGCDIAHAPRLVYARHLNLDTLARTEIGVNCYLCERPNCASRAYPPLSRPLAFSDRERSVSSFGFADAPAPRTGLAEGGRPRD